MSDPVFNDTSGTRLSAVRWGSRIFLLAVVLLGVAVALTLRSPVEVPGLQRFGPVLDSQELRPAEHPVRADPPIERATVKTGSSSFQPQPTPGRVSESPVEPAHPGRRAVAPSTAAPAVEPSDTRNRRPTAGPTASSRPTASATPPPGTVGPGTVKARNPRAATPNPRSSEAPGRNRAPKPKPTTGSADRRG